MEPARGDFFFHYTTRDAAFGDILPRKRIRLSPYSKVRDPLEYKAYFTAAYFEDSFKDEEGKDPALEIWSKSNELAARLRRETKLLALTVDAAQGYEGEKAEGFGRGWSRTRMWEQYAENHEGVCLMFRRDNLKQRLKEGLTAQGAGALYDGEVRYTETGLAGEPQAQNLALDQFVGGKTSEAMADHLEKHHRELYFLKTRDWESEHEYRFVTLSPGADYQYVEFGDDVVAFVVVGEKFPRWQIAGALETCKLAKVQPLRLTWWNYRPIVTRLQVPDPMRFRPQSRKPPPEAPPHPPAP
jgi:hypothetical protein